MQPAPTGLRYQSVSPVSPNVSPNGHARPYLVSSTKSPLASPKTPIHRLASSLQSCLYFPDPGPLYAVCGALAANMLKGYPCWLMVIGPPESGKTELLRPLLELPGVRECGDLSGKAALLSATKAKDVAVDATGGILKDMHHAKDGSIRGALVMLDFARTVLAADSVSSRSTMGAIGMLHDQHYQREVGTDGGKTISFSGRIGFLAASTDVIDHPDHQQTQAEMGDRCLYYRYPESDGYHEIESALDNPDSTSKTGEIKGLFSNWSSAIDLDWEDLRPPRPLEEPEKRMISALAQLCARGRSGVQRDPRHHNEISGVTRSALGPRIANSLAQLLRGMEACGCTSQESARVLRQCAMDSMPAMRAMTIRRLAETDQPTGTSWLARELKVSMSAARRALEDLNVHGLTDCSQTTADQGWTLSDRARQYLTTSGIDDNG